MAKLADHRDKAFLAIIWNGFLLLLNDTNHDVMLNLAKDLLNIFVVFARDQTDGLLNGSICSLPAVRANDLFVVLVRTWILCMLIDLFSNRSWIRKHSSPVFWSMNAAYSRTHSRGVRVCIAFKPSCICLVSYPVNNCKARFSPACFHVSSV